MKKIFTMVAMVIATIVMSSCTELDELTGGDGSKLVGTWVNEESYESDGCSYTFYSEFTLKKDKTFSIITETEAQYGEEVITSENYIKGNYLQKGDLIALIITDYDKDAMEDMPDEFVLYGYIEELTSDKMNLAMLDDVDENISLSPDFNYAKKLLDENMDYLDDICTLFKRK